MEVKYGCHFVVLSENKFEDISRIIIQLDTNIVDLHDLPYGIFTTGQIGEQNIFKNDISR